MGTALTCWLGHIRKVLSFPSCRSWWYQINDVFRLGVAGSALLQRLRGVAVDPTVTLGWLFEVIFQGIQSLFKEQDDVLFLVREVLQALIIL